MSSRPGASRLDSAALIGREKLGELVRKMGIRPRELLRTREPEYRELGLDDPSLSDDEILDALARYPQLGQRP